MAAGSRKKFALDLTDIMAFPDGLNIPICPPKPGESWVSPLEIMKDESQTNPLYLVRDINHGGPLLVELYTPDRFKDAEKFEIGYTVCVTDGTFHAFPDGRNGFRITDPKKIEVLPVPVRKLREINEGLRRRSDTGDLLKCNYCNGPSERECGACKSRYCSKECQKNDWIEHKKICRAVGALHRWNRTDWG